MQLSISHLLRLSRQTVAECGLLIDDSKIHQLSDLYIDRDIESELVQKLKCSIDQTVLIGEAGAGKTSILWNVYRSLMEDEKNLVILLRAETLASFKPDDLATALSSDGENERSRFLLIDTADAALVNPGTRSSYLEAVEVAAECNYAVLMTARVKEASRYLSNIHKVMVPDRYSPRELFQIVETHSSYFYSEISAREIESKVSDILAIVSQQKPVSDLIVRPLMLRMLFSLYAPHQIPSNINVAQLFSTFWERRVQSDWRAGRPEAEPGAADLTEVAHTLAYRMVVAGTIRILKSEALSLLELAGYSSELLWQLVSRGVAKQSSNVGEGDSVEFFHQTFFEHAAARALIARYNSNGIEILVKRLRSSPEDYLRFPVLEQILVISQHTTNEIRSVGQAQIRDILLNGPAYLRPPALFAFVQLPRPTDELKNACSFALKDRLLNIIYIHATASAPIDRWGEMWRSLKDIWIKESDAVAEADAWSSRFAILKQMPRLALSATDIAFEIAAFLKWQNVVASINNATIDTALEVLDALAVTEADASREMLEQLLARVQSGARSERIEAKLILAICARPTTRLDLLVEPIALLGDSELADRIRGGLQAEIWRRSNASSESVLLKVDVEEAGVLSAFSAWLSKMPEEVWNLAWDKYASISNPSLLREWTRKVWDRLGLHPIDKPDVPSTAGSRFLGARIASSLIGPEERRHPALAICRESRSFWLRMNAVRTYRKMQSAATQVEEFYSQSHLGLLLGPGILDQMPAALAALEKDNSLPKDVKKRLLQDAEYIVSSSASGAATLIPFLIAEGAFERVERPIEMGVVIPTLLPPKYCISLRDQILNLLRSPSISKRQTGGRWAYFGADFGVGGYLEYSTLLAAISEETDSSVIIWLARAMCRLAASPAEISAALSWGRKGASGEDKYSRDKAFESWLALIVRTQSATEIDSILEVAQSPECNLKRLRAVANAIPKISIFDSDAAYRVASGLLTLQWLRGKKTVLESFRREALRAFWLWSQQARPGEVLDILRLLPIVDVIVGRMIVKFCYIDPHKREAGGMIQDMLAREDLSDEIKYEISILLRNRSDADDGSEWKIEQPTERNIIAAEVNGEDSLRPSPEGNEMPLVRILFVAANPKGTKRLNVDDELRSLMNELRAVEFRDEISLISAQAVRPDDLVRLLREERPSIVHFSLHGTHRGIVLPMDSGVGAVSGQVLARLFKDRGVRLVVLNGCLSEDQALFLKEVVPAVVGTTAVVSDKAARSFSTAFYRTLGNGHSMRDAFRDGADAVQLHGSRDAYCAYGELSTALCGPHAATLD